MAVREVRYLWGSESVRGFYIYNVTTHYSSLQVDLHEIFFILTDTVPHFFDSSASCSCSLVDGSWVLVGLLILEMRFWAGYRLRKNCLCQRLKVWISR